MFRSRLDRHFIVAVLISVLAAPAASLFGAIIDTQANVSTNVQEVIDDEPGSVNSDDAVLDSSLAEWNISAASLLESTDLDGELVGMGRAYGDFLDPRRLDQPNPEEFALEVACYSNNESLAYVVDAEAVEARTVVFTTPGSGVADPDFEFGDRDTAVVESRVFISGAVVVWSGESQKNLSDVSADLQVRVTRDDTSAVVFDTALSIAGDADGAVSAVTSGSLRSSEVDLAELAELGLDQDSLNVLERLEAEGTLRVIAIPPQEHRYQYTVTADESFGLTATLESRVRNAPNGTGVAVVLGRPFANLAATIDNALPEVNGAELQRTLNAAVANRAIGLVTDSPRGLGRSGMCGAMGGGGMMLLVSMGLVVGARRMGLSIGG